MKPGDKGPGEPTLDVLEPDICVIGAGSGGLTVAAAAAAFGVDVVLIEKGKMGGDCLNYGCVPSKALIAAARRAHLVRGSGNFGVDVGEPSIDFTRVRAHIGEVIAAIEPNDSVERFTGLGVKVIKAEANFLDKRTVRAGDKTIRARRFVIATGSSPMVPPIKGLETVSYFTNETIFQTDETLRHLIIIGGGPIGMELAQAHARLGVEVTVLEGQRAMGKDDPELARRVVESVRRDGVKLLEETEVTAVGRAADGGVEVTVKTSEGERTVKGSHLLVAVGRRPNVSSLALDAAGVALDKKGAIRTNSSLRTTNRHVYAVGDVAGGYQFTHWAGYEGGLVIRSILFRFGGKLKPDIIPWTTYTDPELAHVGLSEDEARKRHGKIRILRWPLAENDRAQAERTTGGMIKVITTRRGAVLGADIVAPHAGELIAPWALAVANGMKIGAFAGTVLPYPTLSEIGKRAAIEFYKPSLDNPLVKRLVNLSRALG